MPHHATRNLHICAKTWHTMLSCAVYPTCPGNDYLTMLETSTGPGTAFGTCLKTGFAVGATPPSKALNPIQEQVNPSGFGLKPFMFTEFRLTGGGQVPVYCNYWNMSKTCQKLFRNPCLLCRLANINWNSASCNHCGGQTFSTLAKWWLCWGLQKYQKLSASGPLRHLGSLRTQARESIYHIYGLWSES